MCTHFEPFFKTAPNLGPMVLKLVLAAFHKFFSGKKDKNNNLIWDSMVWDIGRSILGIMAIRRRWKYSGWMGRIPESQIFSSKLDFLILKILTEVLMTFVTLLQKLSMTNLDEILVSYGAT